MAIPWDEEETLGYKFKEWVSDKKRDIERFVAYRTYDRYNKIEIPTLDHKYWEIDTRMLHGMFSLLVSYVEKQCAHMWNSAEKFYGNEPLSNLGEAGIKWLKFQHDFQVNEVKADRPTWAEEAITLYRWWTEDRKRRPDPYKNWKYEGGISLDEPKEGGGVWKPLKNIPWKPDNDKRGDSFEWDPIEIEEQYYEEDTEMLKRLIDIRSGLWT